MSTASTLKQDLDGLEQGSGGSIASSPYNQRNRLYRLMMSPWLSFGIAAASFIVVICSLYIARYRYSENNPYYLPTQAKSSSFWDMPIEYSIAMIAGGAVITFGFAGLATKVAEMDAAGSHATPQ